MIDLKNTYVVIRTQEERKNILKEAEKQRFQDIRPFTSSISLPYILQFKPDYFIDVFRISSEINFIDYKCYELTAREFIKGFYKIRANCKYTEHCDKCKLSQDNTKCEKFLCDIFHWENNEDELIKIMIGVISEQKAIECVKNFIQNSYETLDEDIVNALEFVVKK